MNVIIPAINWSAIGPELILSLTAMGLLILNVFAQKAAKGALPYLSLAGIVVALVLCISLWGKSEYAFN